MDFGVQEEIDNFKAYSVKIFMLNLVNIELMHLNIVNFLLDQLLFKYYQFSIVVLQNFLLVTKLKLGKCKSVR